MRTVEKDIDRILALLRNHIRQQGFTQLEVQEVNGWGRSYISQLLSKQKSLRVEHVLMMLKVIKADPAKFFAELYQFGDFTPSTLRERRPARRRFTPSLTPNTGEGLENDMRDLGILMEALQNVLMKKKLISKGDLDEAVKKYLPSR